ncbi:MAG: HNH endonuclease signature motif containing protein [Alphaproteobacteria bacterium]|nr:HNH endonuclease signature motif containing protein [Alphaproteobacteria bacterium]
MTKLPKKLSLQQSSGKELSLGNERESSSKRGYDRAWRKAREYFLKSNPYCKHCKAQGRTVIAKVVDHVVPHKGNMSLFRDRTNWQPLCIRCHNVKTAKEDGGFGRSPKGGG